jgi:hypothetical protein
MQTPASPSIPRELALVCSVIQPSGLGVGVFFSLEWAFSSFRPSAHDKPIYLDFSTE